MARDDEETLTAIDPGCNSAVTRHRCVRGANHAGLHYDHDGYEWADRYASRPDGEPGRPVYVLAVGHDLDATDAENIQRAVMAALRERKEAPDGP